MTYHRNIFLHVVCEGKSERNYISALNRLLRDDGIALTLHSPAPRNEVEDGGGHYTDVIKRYKEICSNNRNIRPWIWADRDLYVRNERGCMDMYRKKPKGIPDFLFSIQNFEDFLVLHHSTDRVHEWVELCRERNHFDEPMLSKEYMPLLKTQFPEYKKGELPDCLSLLTNAQVENALIHSLDDRIPIKCDFIEHLADFIMRNYPGTGRPWNIIRSF